MTNENCAYVYSKNLVDELDKIPKIRGRVSFIAFYFYKKFNLEFL